MSGRRSGRRTVLWSIVSASCLPFAVAGFGARPASGGGTTAVRVLYPANRSLVAAGAVRFIAAAPLSVGKVSATLDGKRLVLQRVVFDPSWMLTGALKKTAEAVGDRSATALWVARVALKPGLHTASVGGVRLSVRARRTAKEKAPTGWVTGSAHSVLPAPGAKLDCASCHEMNAGALGSSRTPAACAGCHDDSSVLSIHHHTTGPLARCAGCHDPHGASRPRLLTDTRAKLCRKCHESGHWKG